MGAAAYLYSVMSIDAIISRYRAVTQDMVDYEKYYLMSISFHSTALEGSTLSYEEAEALLDKGVTSAARPLAHHLMVKDHHDALTLTLPP